MVSCRIIIIFFIIVQVNVANTQLFLMSIMSRKPIVAFSTIAACRMCTDTCNLYFHLLAYATKDCVSNQTFAT